MNKPTPSTPTPKRTPHPGKGRRKIATSKKKPRPNHSDRQIIDIDRLPASAILRAWAVAQLLCCSRSTVWRYSKMGKLATPVKAGDNLTGWRVGDIKTFLESIHEEPTRAQVRAAVIGAKKARDNAKAPAR